MLIGITIISFAVIHLAPGEPVQLQTSLKYELKTGFDPDRKFGSLSYSNRVRGYSPSDTSGVESERSSVITPARRSSISARISLYSP